MLKEVWQLLKELTSLKNLSSVALATTAFFPQRMFNHDASQASIIWVFAIREFLSLLYYCNSTLVWEDDSHAFFNIELASGLGQTTGTDCHLLWEKTLNFIVRTVNPVLHVYYPKAILACIMMGADPGIKSWLARAACCCCCCCWRICCCFGASTLVRLPRGTRPPPAGVGVATPPPDPARA